MSLHLSKLAPVALFLAVFAIAVVSCRDKEDPVGPGDEPEPGQWSMTLRNEEIFYRATIGGEVANEIITVRLYDEFSNLADGVRIRCRCQFSPNRISAADGLVRAESDTAQYPSGARPNLIYYGHGPDEDAPEVCECWAVLDNGDTIPNSRAITSFFVRDPPDTLQIPGVNAQQ